MTVPKKIEIEYDAESMVFFIILTTKDGQTEIMTTASLPEEAELLAESYAYNFGVRYEAKDICGNDCGRNLPPSPRRPPAGTYCACCAGEVPTRKCINGKPYPEHQRFCDCWLCEADRELAEGMRIDE